MTKHDDASRWEAVEEAVELLNDEQTEAAIPMLRATLEGDPANAYAHFYLGSALASQSQHGPALVAFSEAERRSPEYLGAIVAQGWCLHELGRFAEAVRAGDRALALRSEDPDALWLLAVLLSETGDKARAISCAERFLKTNPSVEARHEADALLAALWGRARPLDPAE